MGTIASWGVHAHCNDKRKSSNASTKLKQTLTLNLTKFGPNVTQSWWRVPSFWFWDFFLVPSYKSKAGSSNYANLRFPFSSKLLNPVLSRVYGSRSLPNSSKLPGQIPGQHWIKPSWNENTMKVGFGWKSAITFLGFLKINQFFKIAKKSRQLLNFILRIETNDS